jgi:hypothetical protein
MGNRTPRTRFLTTDWTASIPPQAVPADIKQKPRSLRRGFCRHGSPPDVTRCLAGAEGRTMDHNEAQLSSPNRA